MWTFLKRFKHRTVASELMFLLALVVMATITTVGVTYYFYCDYQRTSANFRRRWGIDGVRMATQARRSTILCSSNRLLKR